MRRSANIVLSAASLVLVAGAATGVAEATTSHAPAAGSAVASSTSSTANSVAAKAKTKAHPRARELRHIARHVAHGSVVVKMGSAWKTVDFQRGTLTAASGSAVTVKSADGFTATYAVTGTTRVRVDRAKSAASKLTTGSRVVVFGVKDGSTVNAKWIVERTGALKAPAAAGSGTHA